VWSLINIKAVPLQAWSGPEGSRKLRFPDFMKTTQDGGKVVSRTHRPPLPPGNVPGTHFCQRLNRPKGHSVIGRILCHWKMTRAGIVAQHLNHCATAVSRSLIPAFIIMYSRLSKSHTTLWCYEMSDANSFKVSISKDLERNCFKPLAVACHG